MGKFKRTPVYVYKNEKGQIYMIRVVQGNQVVEMPCENTRLSTIEKTMKNLFGRIQMNVVEILPD